METNAFTSEETKALLNVAQWPKIGVVKVRRLARTIWGSASRNIMKSAVDMFGEDYSAYVGKSDVCSMVDELLTRCAALDCRIISILDAKYPPLLASIDDAPPFLYVLGDESTLRMPGAAVVGTRKCSETGKRWALKIGEVLAENGFVTTSGLALGIDAAAHNGAIKGNGRTIAVMAHGLDVVAPKRNSSIADSILELGGCLVSEHPPGVPPRPPEFVRRNRIQSGLSLCSVVVESAASGGTMHQAKFTVDQSRRLFAVYPEQSSDFNYDGANRLLREFGAEQLRSRDVLLSFLANSSSDIKNEGTQHQSSADNGQMDLGL